MCHAPHAGVTRITCPEDLRINQIGESLSVRNGDSGPSRLYELLALEIIQCAGDSFARCANHLRDFFVTERQVHFDRGLFGRTLFGCSFQKQFGKPLRDHFHGDAQASMDTSLCSWIHHAMISLLHEGQGANLSVARRLGNARKSFFPPCFVKSPSNAARGR